MNEIKRQLNRKMGDTGERANAIMQKVEAEKRDLKSYMII